MLLLPRNIRPMRLSRRSDAFDSDQFIFELKVDGFRALAHIDAGRGELISRNGNVFRGFAELADWLASTSRWMMPLSMVRSPVSMTTAAQSFENYYSGSGNASTSLLIY